MADYAPERGPKIEGIDFTHGLIKREHGGVITTAGQAIIRRLFLHGGTEVNCYDHEVLLPRYAPDHLRKLDRLVAAYEDQMLPAQLDLMGIATVRFSHDEPFHRQWELARGWVRSSFNDRHLAAVLVHHVPAFAGRAHKPHLHALYFPRALHGVFGAFLHLERGILAAEWKAHIDRVCY